MAVKLNHTIVHAHDKRESAEFFSEVFGLDPPIPFGPFLEVETANEVILAFSASDEPFDSQHYAFLVSDAEFDAIFDRIQARRITYWADPEQQRAGKINRRSGGRGLYFEDPGGNLLEIITRA